MEHVEARAARAGRRAGRPRFWSTTITRKSRCVWNSSEVRQCSSSSTRPTVATTRSNDGSSCCTRRRLRDARGDRPARVRAPRRLERRALPADGARERRSGRPCADLELLVVDDGSTDCDAGDARRRSTTRGCACCETRSGSGLAASLNRGLDEARGRYVARLDADDVAMPRRLERQLARIGSSSAGRGRRERGARAGRLRPARAGCIGCRRGRRRCAGRRSSARRSSIRASLVDRERARRARPALRRRRTSRARTTTCGRGCSTHADGDNVRGRRSLLYRVHPGQASRRRRGPPARLPAPRRAARDRSASRRSSRRSARSSPGASAPASRSSGAARGRPRSAFVELAASVRGAHGAPSAPSSTRRGALAGARSARAALACGARRRARSSRMLARLDPALPARVAARPRSARLRGERAGRAEAWLAQLDEPGGADCASRRSSPSRRRTGRRSSTASRRCPRST